MILTNKDTLCNRYIRRQIDKYKRNKLLSIGTNKPIKGVAARKKISPLLIKVLHIKSILSGLSYEFISDAKGMVKDDTVIYAVTHIGKFDYEMVMEACNIFAYAFAGDWELSYATIDDYFFRAKGVLYVDTGDKEDRKNSFQYMVKLLKQGTSMIIFPEGIWNLTENLPTMKIFPGAVQAAKECQVPIVPIAIEQVGKHFVLNVGEQLQFDNVEEKDAVQTLRDTLATLRWKIWEYLPQEKRSNLPVDYYERFLEERLKEYDVINMELINRRMYKDKTDREIQEIERDLKKLRNCAPGM